MLCQVLRGHRIYSRSCNQGLNGNWWIIRGSFCQILSKKCHGKWTSVILVIISRNGTNHYHVNMQLISYFSFNFNVYEVAFALSFNCFFSLSNIHTWKLAENTILLGVVKLMRNFWSIYRFKFILQLFYLLVYSQVCLL